jgi:hypothetical protein
MRTKLFTIFSWIVVSILFVSILVFGYWAFYSYKVISFEQVPFPIINENKTVKAGEFLVYEVEYCKYMKMGAETTRSFVDGVIYSLPAASSNRDTGCHDNKIYIEVPKTLPPSYYTLSVLYRFKVNPIRTIDFVQKTEQFRIVR